MIQGCDLTVNIDNTENGSYNSCIFKIYNKKGNDDEVYEDHIQSDWRNWEGGRFANFILTQNLILSILLTATA